MGLSPEAASGQIATTNIQENKHFKVVLPAKNLLPRDVATEMVDQEIEKSDLQSQATFFVEVACGLDGTQAPYRWKLASLQEE